jgi:hypothetical protein
LAACQSLWRSRALRAPISSVFRRFVPEVLPTCAFFIAWRPSPIHLLQPVPGNTAQRAEFMVCSQASGLMPRCSRPVAASRR